ncbi:MAG TPA: 3-phosphoshikimate 1-carboxyvinyltransferase [Treponemataceae bacterium]|nr:3-phosphoshikimate 1-carboxyvinyltransferase [Treponemataceae bacterium]
MNIKTTSQRLTGSITVPGSKSHTIRAVLLASMAEGTSKIYNPLPSTDCVSAANAVSLMGAKVVFDSDMWTVNGAGSNLHLPEDVVNVNNSGSTLYFLTPIAACFTGWSVFTGDESIRSRPVAHMTDMLEQLGAHTEMTRPDSNAPPFIVRGPIQAGVVRTDGQLSQYITGMMMAATRLSGTTYFNLADPKETPYLKMTKLWLNRVGVSVQMSDDFKQISLCGPQQIKAFEATVPSDWEAVAFPLIAALMSNSSKISIENIDVSGSQGDDAIVDILQAVGADIKINTNTKTLFVCGSSPLKGDSTIKTDGFPDAICALAVIACFIEGTTTFTDIDICRSKETDRIRVMAKELAKLGADIKDCGDTLVVHGSKKGAALHGGIVESYGDHRVAMALVCAGFGLPDGESITVKDAECFKVSFPLFIETMNELGAKIKIL